jgi:hypothetical protein
MFMVAVPSVNANLALSINTSKTFRQDKSGATNFISGSYNLDFRDGGCTFVNYCTWPYYYPPNDSFLCSGGTTGFITFGEVLVNGRKSGPYFWITDVVPALLVEPRRADLCFLRAAPASKLKRPAGGFADDSFGVYYNLHDKNSVVESIITRYSTSRVYGAGRGQWDKYNSEIVPGVYHYTFPRLHDEISKVPISATIYPMVDGYRKVNNQKAGVRFDPNERWSKLGFMELSYLKPNIIKWSGFTPSTVYAGVDTLHFALRYIKDPKDANSPVLDTDPVTGDSPASLFPAFVNDGGDPRVALTNPFINSFTLPPVLKSGTKAVAELSLDRSLNSSGVNYDYSSRKFQIPVEVVNRYTDYADINFGNSSKRVGILDDNDKDGFNNLTEWMLGSRADDEFSVPVNPVPANQVVTDDNYYYYYWYYWFYDYYKPQWFGFTVDKIQRNVPRVKYTLQRSTNMGKSWSTFTSDVNWRVTDDAAAFVVESLVSVPVEGAPDLWVQPPGTEGHLYRLKITLKK